MQVPHILNVFLICLVGLCQSLQEEEDDEDYYYYYYQDDDFACDFESDNCRWTWNTTQSNGFKLISGEEAERRLRKSPKESISHFTDGDNNLKGHYLFVAMEKGDKEVHVWSSQLSMTRPQCKFHVRLRMVNMSFGDFKVVVGTVHGNTSWVIDEIHGNDLNTWEEVSFKLGRVQQEIRILLEVTPSSRGPSQVSLDNIKLVDCFEDQEISKNCPKDLFECSSEVEDFCLNYTKVCDIEQDCVNGRDEEQGCEKIPSFARCTFEDGWCGWESSANTDISWVRATGTGVYRRYVGPAFDNTYKNESGVFLYVDLASPQNTRMGSLALLESKLINPPPPYHSRPSSRYYKSCYLRFFYHQYGPHTGSLALFLLEMDPSAERLERLWFTYGNKGDLWQREVIQIPTNITHRYVLQFEARRGLRARGDIALDDVALSPECFGLNVPEDEKDGYDYNTFTGYFRPTKAIVEHRDFVDKVVYLFTTCGAKGRMGPTPANCSAAYNNTNTNVTVLQDATLRGVQRWTVPRDAYYTIIANGAGGGKGYDGSGVSKGATVVGVVELWKGQSVYILVGQEGGDACKKNFVFPTNYSCGNFKFPNKTMSPIKALKELQKMEIIDDAGGGGGASYVFLWSQRNGRIPLIISGGGGGLGGPSSDDGSQHGKGIDIDVPGVTGTESGNNSAGAGGGWTDSKGIWREVTGGSFVQGAVGGKACGSSSDIHGSGGFGGGGGGCRTGGGGGGYAGGSAATGVRNGQGGHSYVARGLTYKIVLPGNHVGPGSVMIIPAIKGCGCDYLCVALDEYRQKVKCICPNGSQLQIDGVSCLSSNMFQTLLTEKFLLGVLTVLLIILICLYIYNNGLRRRDRRRRKVVVNEPPSEPETSDVQLSRLRVTSSAVAMMTEFNPNYEFAGGTYSVSDLLEVPRDNLRLVKPLGQGAFGEVYQGFFRRSNEDEIEMPVAVKTLPELSTGQAEADFVMEALIMSKFTHPNIVHFIGVCFDRHPRFIVLELLSGGDLKNFLRESRPKPDRPSPLEMRDLLMCALDIARGCAYMEEHRFIHRDIAARNCLLTTKGPGRTAKIADFGMARDIYRSDYYRKGGKAMLPIKWMPPEAFQDGMFTIKTDIWSFGILLWEVMSLGYMPYPGCGNRDVMRLVASGGRLHPPKNCPPPLYSIMAKCWEARPEDRPNFQLILERLGYCLQDPEVMNTPLPTYNLLPPPDVEIVRPRKRRRFVKAVDEEDDDDDDEDNDHADYDWGDGYIFPKNVIHELPMGESSTKGSYSWEPKYTLPESQSTQPLLEKDIAGPSCEPGPSGIQSHRRSQTSPLSLDAGTLIALTYCKPSPKKQHSEGSGSDSPSSRHLNMESETTC